MKGRTPSIFLEIGQVFGRLTVISEPFQSNGKRTVRCRCTCGKEIQARPHVLKNGDVRSCGCIRFLLPHGEAARRHVFRIYKASAKHKGLEFALSYEMFTNLVTKPCYYCGAEKTNEAKHYNNGHGEIIDYDGSFQYTGLDRVVSTHGYTQDNVIPCCIDCNIAKLTRSQDEFFAHIERIYKYRILQDDFDCGNLL